MSKEHAPIEFKNLPVVKNELLRKEHVEYCVAWHKEIGDRNKAIYYKMGADASTVLFTTNATNIIGIDSSFPVSEYSQDYVNKYWDLVDQKPILNPEVIRRLDKDAVSSRFQPSKEKLRMFTEDLAYRKQKGYWSHRAPLQFDNDRLLVIELKRLGVKKESIKITANPDTTSEITFNWAFPGERSKARKITYLPQFTVTEAKRKVISLLKDSDCYYQKGLSPENTYAIVQDVQPYLKEASIVAIGFQYKRLKDNFEYQRELGVALGHWYKPLFVDAYFNRLIDNLPEDDLDYEDNKYGMKIHVFERKQYPIRRYKYNFGGVKDSSL